MIKYFQIILCLCVSFSAVGAEVESSFEQFLPTGRRQYVNNPRLNAFEWPRSVLISDAQFENGVDVPELPLDPVFGESYFAGGRGYVVEGCRELAMEPLTVRLRVKLRSADQFNIFVAYEPKSSADHWELYSFRGDGALSLFMPGNKPNTIRSKTSITDNMWHDVAAVISRERVVLYIDGVAVAQAGVTRPFKARAGQTRMGIGRLVEGALSCNGWIDDLSIRSEAEVITNPLTSPQLVDEATLFYSDFKTTGSGGYSVVGVIQGILPPRTNSVDMPDRLFPRGSVRAEIDPDVKPPKNVPVKVCSREQLAAAVRRLGLRSVSADDFRSGVLSFWGEHVMELQSQIEGKMPLPRGAAGQVYDQHALIQPGETPYDVVVRRTGALLDHLQKRRVDVGSLRDDWQRLKVNASPQAMDVFAACALRRAVMFANPDLQTYDKLVFLGRATYAGSRLTNMKNTDRTGGHFATQCFGFNTIHGGGIFTLDNWRSLRPEVRNLTEGKVVCNGRLKGRALDFGSFYTPSVSYDGKTIYFAHCGASEHRWVWSNETTWNLFGMDLDSGRITQLTDGPWNEFDPVELPSGRIVFISERRGGFIRCFGEGARLRVPTYVLHSMKSDGSDIYPISYYETSEWQPSVDNNGMLVYTRWDYTDRENCLGSCYWTCYPDGRDPRAPHGNYPQPWHTFKDNVHGDHRFGKCDCGITSALPMTEMQIRAIPGSHRYIYTAAPHHGETFGSLCMLDLRVPGDGHMSQIRRLTPYVPFPESECAGRSQYVYATAWAVNENLYLCNRWEDLVILDRFGNEELVCERELLPVGYDPRLRLTHPKPLRARPKPPVIPRQTAQGEDFVKADKHATIGVVNVRISDLPFPENRRPERLRVLQAIPKTDPWMDRPRIGYGNESTPRIPLGTVPLQKDGSAFFQAPAGKQLIFQVLDENNMAIQTMRSTAFVHPGEQLTCLGCHEKKNSSYNSGAVQPLAFQHKPSVLEPECGPVEPVNFYRLVEPIIKSRCLACHTENGNGPQKMDYNSLKEYAYYFEGGMRGTTIKKDHGGSRSIPGRCGAYASRIGKALLTEHHMKVVSAEERHRVILWLDANALRYSTYHNLEAQERGELVWPLIDVDPANPLANAD